MNQKNNSASNKATHSDLRMGLFYVALFPPKSYNKNIHSHEGVWLSMRKKLEGNGLWESSRWRLPQQQDSILNANSLLGKRTKPVLDEQHSEELIRRLGVAMFSSLEAEVTIS